jgi:hypothetical protein
VGAKKAKQEDYPDYYWLNPWQLLQNSQCQNYI